jgi:hypothetical protein
LQAFDFSPGTSSEEVLWQNKKGTAVTTVPYPFRACAFTHGQQLCRMKNSARTSTVWTVRSGDISALLLLEKSQGLQGNSATGDRLVTAT